MKRNPFLILCGGLTLFFGSCSTRYATDDSASLVKGGNEFTVINSTPMPVEERIPETLQQMESSEPLFVASQKEGYGALVVTPKRFSRVKEIGNESITEQEIRQRQSKSIRMEMHQHRKVVQGDYHETLIQSQPRDDDDEIAELLIIIIAILLPPLAVFLLFGLDTEFWIDLILTILLYLPGLIYALIKILDYYDEI